MNQTFLDLCEELKGEITKSYELGITMPDAERLASKFLSAQMVVAEELRKSDLDFRMKKNGTKAVKAAVYMDAATKGDKKPSDVFIQNLVDLNEIVQSEQTRQDEAEVIRDSLTNYYNIFREAHIHFRSIARGRFE